MTTQPRNLQPEIMDSPLLDERRHRRALDALARINRISCAARQVWRDIARARPDNGAPFRILDLACGGGDVLMGIERLADLDGVTVELSGCDVSPTAVARARERAARSGSKARFFRLDVLDQPLPDDADVIYSTLFLHHLDNEQAVALLGRMADACRRSMVIQDLERSRLGYALAFLGVRVLTRSRVARVDGPRSVQASFTPAEALSVARRAGLEASVRRFWPARYSLTWARS